MKVGITIPNLGPQATRENVLLTATRILWPLKPQSAYSGTSDGTLPIEYQNVLDPLDVLVYVAANTSTRHVLLYSYNACNKTGYPG